MGKQNGYDLPQVSDIFRRQRNYVIVKTQAAYLTMIKQLKKIKASAFLP